MYAHLHIAPSYTLKVQHADSQASGLIAHKVLQSVAHLMTVIHPHLF